MIIDGREISEGIISKLHSGQSGKPRGSLLVMRDASNNAQNSFVNAKRKIAERLGIEFTERIVETESKAVEILENSAVDSKVGGVIVQLPIPESWNLNSILSKIPPEKDLDLLNTATRGLWFDGKIVFVPPSVRTTKYLLDRHAPDYSKREVALVGEGRLIGSPIADWFKKSMVSIDSFNSKNPLGANGVSKYDILILGAGEPGLVKGADCKNGALIVDFGFSLVNGKIIGDFDPTGAEERDVSYTKTPGGTGPILVASLFENIFKGNFA